MNYQKLFLLSLFAALSFACSADDATYHKWEGDGSGSGDGGDGDDTTVTDPTEEQFVSNYDFEEEIDFATSIVEWRIGGGSDTATTDNVEWVEGKGYKDSNCIKLSSSSYNDIGVIQKLQGLNPGKLYRLTAKVKTENVESEGGGGVNLSISGQWYYSEFLQGTNDWTEIYLDFAAPASGEIEIVCRLGFWNEFVSKGIVYFDNVRTTESPEQVYSFYGEDVSIHVPTECVSITDDQMYEWVSQLDRAYTQYEEMFGQKAFGGEMTAIIATKGIPSYVWAWAGNPVFWNQNYVSDALRKVVEFGDDCFGLLHEIGHNFAPGAGIPGNGEWRWDEEMLANFRMSYVLEMQGMSVYMNDQLYTGKDVINYYKVAYDTMIAQGYPTGNDAIHYTLLRITGQYGWQPIIDAFAELYASSASATAGMDEYDKFINFLSVISKHAGADVKATYSTAELGYIEQGLRYLNTVL